MLMKDDNSTNRDEKERHIYSSSSKIINIRFAEHFQSTIHKIGYKKYNVRLSFMPLHNSIIFIIIHLALDKPQTEPLHESQVKPRQCEVLMCVLCNSMCCAVQQGV